MKKLLLPVAIALSAVALTACNDAPAQTVAPRIDNTDTNTRTQDIVDIPEDPDKPDKTEIRITIDGRGGFDMLRPSMPGIRRHFDFDPSGNYSVEYIHTPFGVERDETLDFKIELRADNTFDMTVVSEGVQVEHNGRWYAHHGNITLFYDEQIEPPAHNVYVADSLYCELLPQGKLMVYENGHTVVLTRENVPVLYK